ncbi:hypothetical protein H0R92_13800, partial [Treponema sp. OMZ 840]|uniref:hypothetical protein n=1 Tax=Treponema sp. OMZ 840 TaxID=244313 RepID=UPI003D8D5630
MTSGQKVAVSLLTSVLIFAAFTVAAFLGLFSAMETRFYQPALVRGIHKQLASVSHILDDYLSASKTAFYTEFAENEYVKKSFSFEQDSQDIKGREDASGNLFSTIPSLTGIRIIESGGKKIHYSTIAGDILQRTDKLVSYRLYKDIGDLPYEEIESPQGESGRILCDPDRDRILYSFPFYDAYSMYRGTIVFYTASSAFAQELVKKNLIAVTDTVIFTGTKERPVFVLSFPNTGREILQNILIKKFSDEVSSAEKLIETEQTGVWLLFSQIGESKIYVSRLYEENLFVFSDMIKTLLLISVFVTSFLIVFLIFNIKQDDMLLIRDRIKRFQFAVINDYLTTKEEVDWNAVYADMKRRKRELNAAIKKSLGRRAKRHSEEVDLLLDKSWDEIIAALHRQSGAKEKLQLDTITAELKEMMEKIISQAHFPAAAPLASVQPAVRLKTVEPLEEVEELEEAGSDEKASPLE